MPFGIDDVIGIGSSAAQLAGGIYESEVAQNMQQKALDFSAGQSATQWQRGVADMKAAGLNPMLAYMHGPNAAMMGSGGVPVNPMEGVASAGQAATAARVNVAAADKTEAEAAEIRARTPTYGVSMDKMRQDISESVAKISNLTAQSAASYASAAQAGQSIENMKAMLPQIAATVRQLTSLAGLQDAKRQEALTAAGLNEAQIAQVNQLVRENLPNLERQLGELERLQGIAAQPGQLQDSSVHDSFIGTLGSVLRTLNPFNSYFRSTTSGRTYNITNRR